MHGECSFRPEIVTQREAAAVLPAVSASHLPRRRRRPAARCRRPAAGGSAYAERLRRSERARRSHLLRLLRPLRPLHSLHPLRPLHPLRLVRPLRRRRCLELLALAARSAVRRCPARDARRNGAAHKTAICRTRHRPHHDRRHRRPACTREGHYRWKAGSDNCTVHRTYALACVLLDVSTDS